LPRPFRSPRRHVFLQVAVLGESVLSPVADLPDLVVSMGEVEPGADVPATGRVEQRDSI
jgi:hypothetical protein